MRLILDTINLEIQRYPFFLRTMTGIARRRAPVFELFGNVVVTSADGVREVFSRPTDFLFGVEHGHQMKLGPFLFGMDASTQYFEEKKALRHGALDGQIQRMRRLVREEAVQQLKTLPPTMTRFDLFGEFLEPVLTRAAARFYGLCVSRAPRSRYLSVGPGERTLAHWIRKLAAVIASSTPAPFGLEELSNGLAHEISDFLNGEIELNPPAESVIYKLLKADVLKGTEAIARCIAGLMFAGAGALKGAAHSLHELLELQRTDKELFGSVLRAARADYTRDYAGAATDNEPPHALLGYAWEALRFRPAFPLLLRYCPRDTLLASGTPQETRVRANQTVLISPLAAMFDPSHVERPGEFLPARPLSTYFHFGFGMHRCFGERLAMVMLPELFAVLLTNVAIDFSKPRTLAYEGPAVASYTVTCMLRAEECKGTHEAKCPYRTCATCTRMQAA